MKRVVFVWLVFSEIIIIGGMAWVILRSPKSPPVVFKADSGSQIILSDRVINGESCVVSNSQVTCQKLEGGK